jgi:hypothetical protein
MSGLATILILLQQAPDVAREASRAVARQECAATDKDEIVICGNRGRSPYRLPEPPPHFDPFGDMPSVMAEREAWADAGDSGIQSCSPVGPGGWTGCMVKEWKRQRDQTQWGKNIPSKRW